MARSVIPAKDEITSVNYFSAYADWIPNRAAKHRKYIEALKTRNVSVIMGRFKWKDKTCPLCHKKFIMHEEKQTDVNIALKVLEDAMADKFDTVVLVSGDTDFLSIITTVKRLYPEKRFGIMLPIGSKAKILRDTADFHIKMKKKHLEQNQLPPKIETPHGSIMIPSNWN